MQVFFDKNTHPTDARPQLLPCHPCTLNSVNMGNLAPVEDTHTVYQQLSEEFNFGSW